MYLSALFVRAMTSPPRNIDMDSSSSPIPIIDIQALVSPTSALTRREAVAAQIRTACKEIGFFAITNHGISNSTINDLLHSSEEFFDLPVEQKMLAKSADEKEYPYGYERSEMLTRGKQLDRTAAAPDVSCAATDIDKQCHDEMDNDIAKEDGNTAEDTPDPKETYSIGPMLTSSGEPYRRYPPTSIRPPNMVATHDAYYAAMEALAHKLLRGFALALDLDEDWFEDKFTHHQCALRTLNYPQVDGGEAKPGSIRAGAHTDYGAFTILYSGGPGLQVKKDVATGGGGEDQEGGWVSVPHVENAFIVNIGDMMRRWTNDVWVSTLHRVIVPESTETDPSATAERRQSVAFFVNANGDAVVKPISTCITQASPAKYDSVTAGEYLLKKHLASMGKDM